MSRNTESFSERYPTAHVRGAGHPVDRTLKDRGQCRYCPARLISKDPGNQVCPAPECQAKRVEAQKARKKAQNARAARKRRAG